MSRKRKFHQISKEYKKSNDYSSMQPISTINKITKWIKKMRMRRWSKNYYEFSRRKNITIYKSKIQRSNKHIISKKESQSDEEIINFSIKIEEEKKCTKQV